MAGAWSGVLSASLAWGYSPGLARVVGCVYGFIGVCSLISVAHPALRRPEQRAVRQAINSWWPPALVGGAAVFGGPLATLLIFAGVSAWALREFIRLLPPEDRQPGLVAPLYVGVALHYALIPWGAWQGWALWLCAALPLIRAWRYGPQGVIAGAGRAALGLLLTTFTLGHVAMLSFMELPAHPAGASGLAALLMLCVMANDAGQYVIGKLWGRRRLAPQLSPKKTWEGLLGGVLITALVAALAAPSLAPLGRAQGACVGSCLALLGVLGDLLISAVKRDAGVKDSGAVLPGQGGVLDRVDSLLISAPLYVTWIKVWWT